jgi:hypothetical protein
MTYYIPTSTASTTIDVNMVAGDAVYVAPDVVLTDTTPGYYGIYDTGWGDAEIDGSVAASAALSFNGTSGEQTDITIGTTGSINGIANYSAVAVYSGTYSIANSGHVSADGNGFDLRCPGTLVNYGTIEAADTAVDSSAASTADVYVYNYGAIQSGGSDGIYVGSSTAYVWNFGTVTGAESYSAVDGNTGTFDNSGTVAGGVYFAGAAASIYNSGVIYGYSAYDTVTMFGTSSSFTNSATGVLQGEVYFNAANSSLDNAGTINGGVDFQAGADTVVNSGVINGSVSLQGGEIDSTLGSIDGSIAIGNDGGVAIGGQTGGSIVGGGAGNDVFYANPTQTAAIDAAQTTLEGGAGDNWLYGDGAFTTFMSGDNSAGTYNQIFGGQSEMADVSGYANNTVSYANLSSAYKSVYVNLLDGDAYMCSIADANGAPTADYTFEDYLKNVPNVIGSSGSDVIICDDGVDTITHGDGAGDIFYAGAGAGSQDTFVYTAMDESPLSNHDIIEGFKVGIDKLNFSQLDLPIADFLLSYGGAGSNTVYVEENPSTGFHSATDMIISIQASTSTALSYKDIIT